MASIKLAKEEVYDAYEDGKAVATRSWRWGTEKDIVFVRDGKHYMMTVRLHSQEGLQADETDDAVEVRPVEKTITEWVPA